MIRHGDRLPCFPYECWAGDDVVYSCTRATILEQVRARWWLVVGGGSPPHSVPLVLRRRRWMRARRWISSASTARCVPATRVRDFASAAHSPEQFFDMCLFWFGVAYMHHPRASVRD